MQCCGFEQLLQYSKQITDLMAISPLVWLSNASAAQLQSSLGTARTVVNMSRNELSFRVPAGMHVKHTISCDNAANDASRRTASGQADASDLVRLGANVTGWTSFRSGGAREFRFLVPGSWFVLS